MKLIVLAAALAFTGTAATAQDAAAPAAPAPAATETPTGGYQPSAPPLSGTPQPGQQVVFQASKSPDEAYPAPPAQESYPVCKKGQYDKCRQRGG